MKRNWSNSYTVFCLHFGLGTFFFSFLFFLEPSLFSLVGSAGLFRPLKLYFESLHSNLKPIHGLDGGLSAAGIIKADKSWRKKYDIVIEIEVKSGHSITMWTRQKYKNVWSCEQRVGSNLVRCPQLSTQGR